MKPISLLVAILFATLVSMAQKPDDNPVTVHVSSARTMLLPTGSSGAAQYQYLSVSINGKKYELRAISDGSLLTLGDYLAKLAEDKHKTTYESLQAYDFLFPDGRTVRFTVTGQSE
jgi:hypothetical protein